MPEKVHKRFEDNGPTSSSKLEQSITPSKSTNTAQQINGVKRYRDGSPKDFVPSKVQASERSKTSGKSGQHCTKHVNGDNTKVTQSGLDSNKKVTNGVKQKSSFVNGLIGRGEIRPGGKANGDRRPVKQLSNPQSARKLAAQVEAARKDLPIWSKRGDIRMALRKNDILILHGETGSGKSTQVPQYLCNEPWCKKQKVRVRQSDGREDEVAVGGMIAITQPRRIAATTLAHRVAREMQTPLQKGVPGEVGYAVRFDSLVPPGAKIKFVTEGTLLLEMMRDPNLRRYSAIIVDEIHERSVDVDLITGFLRELVHGDRKGRGGVPLKVVIMSATLDLGGIEAFFAKPGSRPKYKPGKNYGRVLAPHLLEYKIDDVAVSDESRRSSDASFSSWEGFSDSENGGAKCHLPSSQSTDSLTTTTNGIDNGDNQPDSATKSNESSLTQSAGKSNKDVGEVAFDTGVVAVHVEGRQYPVSIFYEINPPTDYLTTMRNTILQLHIQEPLPGDILVFLTGQEEIESLQAQIETLALKLVKTLPRIKVLPLYGSLPGPSQQEAFEPVKEKFTRKIVLATNIAETSVTVSGVRYVVDCGKAKVKQYRPRLGMESLLAKPISAVSAIQRAGRAGRESDGKCYRIYTEKDFANLPEDELPEILRSDPIEAVLKMKARGVDDVLAFPLMDAPDTAAMQKSLLQLRFMGALDKDGTLTEAGRQIASFPLPATFGKVLITASAPSFDVLLEAIDIVSCLTTDSEIYLQPRSEEDQENIGENRKDIQRREGDLITLLTTMQLYAAEHADRVEWCKKRLISAKAMRNAMAIRKQLRQQCLQVKLLTETPPTDPQLFEPITPQRAELLLKAFLGAFGVKTAMLAPDGSYLTLQGRNPIAIHPSSVLHGKKLEAIMFLEHVYTTKNYAKKVSFVQADWLADVTGI